jgi:hypothetical protein
MQATAPRMAKSASRFALIRTYGYEKGTKINVGIRTLWAAPKNWRRRTMKEREK